MFSVSLSSESCAAFSWAFTSVTIYGTWMLNGKASLELCIGPALWHTLCTLGWWRTHAASHSRVMVTENAATVIDLLVCFLHPPELDLSRYPRTDLRETDRIWTTNANILRPFMKVCCQMGVCENSDASAEELEYELLPERRWLWCRSLQYGRKSFRSVWNVGIFTLMIFYILVGLCTHTLAFHVLELYQSWNKCRFISLMGNKGAFLCTRWVHYRVILLEWRVPWRFPISACLKGTSYTCKNSLLLQHIAILSCTSFRDITFQNIWLGAILCHITAALNIMCFL